MRYNEKHVIIPYEKYRSLLKQHESVVETHKQSNVQEGEEEITQAALKGVPESRRPMAAAILTLLDLSANGKLEVTVDGSPIPNSNIEDFIRFTQVDSEQKPAQVRHLYAILAESDIPLPLIGNPKLKDFLADLKQPSVKKAKNNKPGEKRKKIEWVKL